MFLWSLVVAGFVELWSLYVLMEPGCCRCRSVEVTCSHGAWLLQCCRAVEFTCSYGDWLLRVL